MIFIKEPSEFKDNMQVICSICMVLVLIMGITGIFGLLRSNKRFVDSNAEIERLNEVIKSKDLELDESDRWLKIKDDRIIELEGELGKVRGENEELKKKLNNTTKNSLSIPTGFNKFKSYMDYKCIRKDCKQGKIVYGKDAWTDGDGLRKSGEYYCVALGSYYGNIGDKFVIETDKGNTYKIIKADEKANRHTDSTNRYTLANGCMMEWIVEINEMDGSVKSSGNIDNIKKVSGAITKITKIKG